MCSTDQRPLQSIHWGMINTYTAVSCYNPTVSEQTLTLFYGMSHNKELSFIPKLGISHLEKKEPPAVTQ